MTTRDAPWRFRQMQPGEMNIDPIEAEFFSTEALGSLADALVRESVQNSLDARRPHEALTMRFVFSRAPSLGETGSYLKGLFPHLHANRSGLTAMPAQGEPLSFLAVEDFGTRGLQGDPSQSEDDEIDPQPGGRNDFFYFWRNIGRSRKQASELGRWGLGKTVFQAASRINTFFALTTRADDGRRLLLGQSVLKIHKIDGRRYYPYGYFGKFDGDFALPIEESGTLNAFGRGFGLAREDAPGLSVVIPYPDNELTPDAIGASLVRHYFVPIIAGDLVAEIVTDQSSQRIDHTTMQEFVARPSAGHRDDWPRVFSLVRWGMSLKPDHLLEALAPDAARAPRWLDDFLENDQMADQRERFDRGEPVAFRIPVWVKPTSGKRQLSHFDVFMERDESSERADQHFVRDGITVSGVRTSLAKGLRAIVSVRDRPLAQLLGDSENPAHTEWQERSPKFKNRYHHGPFTLRYVKNAPRELARLLTRPSEGRNLTLLQQLFSLRLPTEAELVRKASAHDDEGGKGADTEKLAAIVGSVPLYEIHKRRGGFRLNAAGDSDPTGFLQVSVAYDVRRGNAFSKYQPFDFDLAQAPISIRAKHATIVESNGNTLVVQVRANAFRVIVDGFDEHRDIRVKALPMQRRVVE